MTLHAPMKTDWQTLDNLFDALGFTRTRYFVYASYTSGPELDADR